MHCFLWHLWFPFFHSLFVDWHCLEPDLLSLLFMHILCGWPQAQTALLLSDKKLQSKSQPSPFPMWKFQMLPCTLKELSVWTSFLVLIDRPPSHLLICRDMSLCCFLCFPFLSTSWIWVPAPKLTYIISIMQAFISNLSVPISSPQGTTAFTFCWFHPSYLAPFHVITKTVFRVTLLKHICYYIIST